MNKPLPNIVIVEQPASKPLRLRYESEVRSAGFIPGVSSTNERKTYPTIKIVNYTGPVCIITSCVTSGEPYRPHPHNLIGKDGCANGFSKVNFNATPGNEYCFKNLSIQCTTKQKVHESLAVRKHFNIDPFKTKFIYEEKYDLTSIRLCFQAFLKHKSDKLLVPLCEPVVSSVIIKKKTNTDLVICRISDATSFPTGGKQIILLCDKITKGDIKIRFYELHDNVVAWEDYGVFQPQDVHRQSAITFRTPKYRHSMIDDPVEVFITLQRRSDNAESEPRSFQYVPACCSNNIKKKRITANKEFYDFFKKRKTEDPIAPAASQFEIHGKPEVLTSGAQPTGKTYSSYTGSNTTSQGAVGYGHYVGYASSIMENQYYDPNNLGNLHRDPTILNTRPSSSGISHWNNTQNTQIFNNQYYQQDQHTFFPTQWNIAPQHQPYQQHQRHQQNQQHNHVVEMPTNNLYEHLQFPEMLKNNLTSNQQPDASNLPCLDLNSTELEMHTQTIIKPEEISALDIPNVVENMTDSFNLLSTLGI